MLAGISLILEDGDFREVRTFESLYDHWNTRLVTDRMNDIFPDEVQNFQEAVIKRKHYHQAMRRVVFSIYQGINRIHFGISKSGISKKRQKKP